jgi:hypothetical protein
MIEEDHLTTYSIAFGNFKYKRRISSSDVRKNPLFEQGYYQF